MEEKRNFTYHYKGNKKSLWIAAAIVLIIASGAAFIILMQGQERVCAQVITPATNGTDCIEYPTPCDVPSGWTIVSSCMKEEKNETLPEGGTSIGGVKTLPPQTNPEPNQTNEAPENKTQSAVQGLKVEYFDSPNLAGEPVYTGIVPELNIVWSEENIPQGIKISRFSARFTGKFFIEKEGDYTIVLTSDDGSRMYIDGSPAGNEIWGEVGTISTSTYRRLKEGYHDIKVEYRNIAGPAKIKLEYFASMLNITRQIMPSSVFTVE